MHVRPALSTLILLVAVATSASGADLAIRFDRYQVVGENVTIGGEALLFSVAREQGAWSDLVVPRATILTDEDRDGVVEYPLETEEAPLKSIWVLVDLGDGRSVAAAPEGYELQEARLPEPTDDFARLVDLCERLELAVARPGVGAWAGSLADGGGRDSDGVDDDRLMIHLDDLEPIDDTLDPLGVLVLGDVVVGIDPNEMEYYVLPLTLDFPL